MGAKSLYLARIAGLLACAAGVSLAGTALSAEPLFSYLDPSSDGVLATTAPDIARPALPDFMSSPAAAAAVAEPAVGAWTTVVTSAAATPSGPMAGTSATLQERRALAGPLPGPRLTGTGHSLTGIASYYWQEQMTATGERFNKRDLTAAHKTLPFGTRVRVTRVDTGANVIVRINDRGPFKPGRVIDLSERAAEDIGMTGRGLTAVRLEVLGR